jgi:hypothetical protein
MRSMPEAVRSMEGLAVARAAPRLLRTRTTCVL